MPNPTKGLINVVVGDVKNATIEVLNMVGQQVAIANNVHNQTTFDLSNQAAGVYMVRVTVNGVTSTAKLSVQ